MVTCVCGTMKEYLLGGEAFDPTMEDFYSEIEH